MVAEGVAGGAAWRLAGFAAAGFGTMAGQMLALRALVPVVGHSVPVVALVFGGVLAGLAAGYAAGSRWPSGGGRTPAVCFAAAATLFATALWPPVAELLAGRLRIEGGLGWWAVAAYAFGLPAPAMALAAYPVAAWAAGRGGRLAGRAFAWSTAGNVAGGLATGLVLQDWIGAGGAAMVCVGALGAGGWVAARGAGAWRAWPAAAASFGVLAGGGWFAPPTDLRTAYGDYAVTSGADGTWCVRGNGQRSSCEDGRGTGLGYLEAAEDAFAAAGIRDVLVLGAGGRTFGRGRGDLFDPVFVDVDAGMAAVADLLARRAGAAPPPGRFVAMDARAYLRRLPPGSVEGVLLDAYTDFDAVPGHLLTVEFFALLRSRLAPDGVLAVNVLQRREAVRYRAGFGRTVAAVFADCRTAWRGDRHGVGGPWISYLAVCRPSAVDGVAGAYR